MWPNSSNKPPLIIHTSCWVCPSENPKTTTTSIL
jgi:hypothetical protein